MAFKPYLLAIPLLVEAFLLWERRAWRNLFRAEIFGMGVLIGVYPFLVWQFTPQYFSEILPLALSTYGTYQIHISRNNLAPGGCRLWVATFGLNAVYMIWQRRLAAQRGEWVWILAALGSLICYLAQEKGWTYQLLPAMTFHADSRSYERSARNSRPPVSRIVAVRRLAEPS